MPSPRRKPSPQKHSQRDIVPGFAQIVRIARVAQGWTVKRLADEARVSTTTINAVEREERSASLRVAAALVDALGVKVLLNAPAEPKRLDEYVKSECERTRPKA